MIKGRNGWLTLLFLGLWSLGQLQRFQLTSSIAIYLHDCLIIGFLGLNLPQWWPVAQQWLRRIPSMIHRQPLVIITVGWILVGWALAAGHGVSLLIPVLYSLRLATYVVFGWSLTVLKPWAKADWRFLWLGTGLLFAWFGWLQLVFLPDTRWLAALGWDPHYYRFIGTIMDPGFAGIILVLTLVLWQWWAKRVTLWGRIFVNVALALGVYFTYSRASYLALAVALAGLIIWTGWQSRARLFKIASYLALGLMIAGCILWAPKPSGEGGNLTRTSTITSRLSTTSQALVQLHSYQWITGRGALVDTQPAVPQTELSLPDHARVPDNFLITTVNGTGLIGVVLLGWWLYRAVRWLWQNDRLILIQFGALIVHALFNNSLLEPFVFLWMVGMITTIGKKP